MLLLLMPLTILWASSFERLLVATGNDAISLGLGNNQDDGRSFSALVSTGLSGGLDITFEITSFTDQRVSGKRHDTIDLSVTYPFSIPLGGLWKTEGYGGPGIGVAGPFGLQWAQNFLHSFKDKRPVLLPSDARDPRVHVGLDGQVALTYAEDAHHASLALSVSHRHAWETVGEALVQYRYAHTLGVAVGYQLTKGWSGYPSQDMQEDRYIGLFIKADYDGPLLKTNYLIYPHSGFGYGYIGFDLLAFKAEPTYRKTDLTVNHGLYYELDGSPLRLTSVGRNGFSVDVLYISGPIKPIHRFNISLWQLSHQWEFCNWTALFCPAIKVSVGLKRLNLTQHFDQSLFDEVRPTVGVETSIKIGSKPLWMLANTAYWIRLAASLHYLGFTSSLPAEPLLAPHAKPWTFMLGLTLQIDHDLSALQ